MSFFQSFNHNGQITNIPSSFKRPVLDQAQASQTSNFSNAFNSPSYTLNRSVPLIVSGIATPNTNRATFSNNQPDRCLVHDNWLVSPCTISITTVHTSPTTRTSGAVTLTVIATGGALPYEYSFTNGSTRQSVSDLAFTGNTTGTIIVRDSAGRTATTGYTISNIDTIPPTGSILINGGDYYAHSTGVTLTLSATDDIGGAGVTHMCISDTTSCSARELFTGSKVWSLPAPPYVADHTLYARFQDAAGNVSAMYSDDIRLHAMWNNLIFYTIQ
jgi:hypothetical protein